MQFSYGGFIHPDAEVRFKRVSRQVKFSPNQRANILSEDWDLEGKIVIQGGTLSQYMQALNDRRRAYSVNGYSAGFTNGGSRTQFWLDSSQAIGGVAVTQPISHDDMKGADMGITFLRYTFSLQMESFLSGLSDILDYQERVSFSDIGGGPMKVYRTPVVGPPIIQSVSTSSFYYATQSGHKTARSANPLPEPPIWADALMGEPGAKTIEQEGARTVRNTPLDYTVKWNYRFCQAMPFIGGPHVRS